MQHLSSVCKLYYNVYTLLFFAQLLCILFLVITLPILHTNIYMLISVYIYIVIIPCFVCTSCIPAPITFDHLIVIHRGDIIYYYYVLFHIAFEIINIVTIHVSRLAFEFHGQCCYKFNMKYYTLALLYIHNIILYNGR